HLLGWRKLNAGRHVISFVCAGRDLRSRGYNLGLDTFVVAKVATPVDVRPPRVPSTMPELIETLRDPDPIVRGVAALALRDMRTRAQAALPALARAFADPEVGVRMTAADAIARQGRAAVSVLNDLIAAAKAPNEHVHVQRSLAAALGAIGPGAA